MVYVLDKDGKPLMPTERHGKVRHMIWDGRAKVVKYSPLTIRLLYEPETHFTQPVTLGVDAGSKYIGLSAVTEAKELFSAEMTLRDDIPCLMKKRQESRRTRRGRLRYRPARFNNRKRPKGWLTPTMETKIRSHANIIGDICSILPVSRIIVETASFDIQKIKNEDIEGKQYQEGEQKGYENVKLYVKSRDGYTCQVCGSHEKLEVHHLIPRAEGGSDRPANLITLCEKCHDTHHHVKPLNIPRPENNGFKGATEMNTMRWFLLDRLRKAHLDREILETYGYITNWNRNHLRLEKTHATDAFVIAGHFDAQGSVEQWNILKTRCHNRHLEKDNFKKGGKKQRHQGPRFVKGYQLFSKCRHEGKEAVVTARKSDGRLNLLYAAGTRKKYIGAGKTMLVEHAKTRIYIRRMTHSAPMQT